MTTLVHTGGTLGDMIIQAIGRYPRRTALIDDHSQMTYEQLGERIQKTIATFTQLGLKRGDGVAQLAANRNDVFVIMASAYIMGLRSITLHGMGSVDDHAYIINHAQAKFFIADQIYRERLQELRERCPSVLHWFTHDQDITGQDCFWDQIDQHAPAPLVVTAQHDDVVRLAYTGGTTGKSKGVMLTNRSMWMQALLILGGRMLPDNMRFLCPTPISHGAGAMLTPTLWRGGTIILQKGFDAGHFLRAVEQHRATCTFLVPTMVYAILEHPDLRTSDYGSLRLLSYGAAPMAPSRIREAMDVFGPILAQSYGQTESPSNILYLSPEDHAREDVDTLGSAGMPYPGVTVALLDDNDEPVAAGEVGELCVRSPLVMDGYWQEPELTAQVLRGGWLHTGDMAYRDPHGYYYLVDRKKDMIISGGFNVYPKEIEDVLAAHPAVALAAVIGIPDDKWGEAVKAVVALRDGHTATEAELKELVRAAKGPVNTPKSIDIVTALPLTTLGKADKNELRRRYWDDQTRKIH